MRHRFFYFIILAITFSFADFSYGAGLLGSGHWKNVVPTKSPFSTETSLETDGTNAIFTRTFYGLKKPEPLLVIMLKGPYTISPRPESDKIFTIAIRPKLYTLLAKHASPVLEKLEMSKCAKIGVPLDLQKNKCGRFVSGLESYTLSVVQLEGNNILLSAPYDKKAREDVSVTASLAPLKKQ